MKVVPYNVLLPGFKIKTGYEILAALEKYFSVPRENHDHESLLRSNPDEGLEIKKATSKKELLKKIQGRQKPKCSGDGPTKIKGPGIQRDPVFHVRPLPEPPFDMWWPLVPGLQVPEEDSIEVIGNMNKPWPRDPEEEAKWDKIPLPTQKDIHEQFQGKRRVVEMPGPREFQPGEVEELMRTRTTLADLKHYEETGELIVRE
ncbi:uncharacterized protein LOC129000274 [Macrosteles quadrilineatus]|uniref:uncharacterized protein LOC129000274 n=1 Tax=Macrosteles quadrilineatus TaxID=74068 RepID=UPI0023E21150|nr:uncharacterized protein LOC129000274 [Macrosteles quadrilineatus]